MADTIAQQQDKARLWAGRVAASSVLVTHPEVGYYATHHLLPRAIGVGETEEAARFDLFDLAEQWAEGVLGAGDMLPEDNR